MKVKILILCLFPLLSEPALACRLKQPLTEELKNQADTVFIGQAVAYSPRPEFTPDTKNWKPAVIRFKVEKMLVGVPQEEVEAYWVNETFGESASLEEFQKSFGKRTRVGLRNREKSGKAPNFSDRAWVLQGSCTPPYMWPEKP